MLHDNSVTDTGVEDLCMALRWHPSIHTLWLGANLVSDTGAVHCATLCRRNPNLSDLNLANKWPRRTWSELEQSAHPRITLSGAIALAEQLAACCGLTALNLSEQRVSDKGATALFKVNHDLYSIVSCTLVNTLDLEIKVFFLLEWPGRASCCRCGLEMDVSPFLPSCSPLPPQHTHAK